MRIRNEAEPNRYIDVQIKSNEYDYLHNVILDLSMEYTRDEIIQQVNMIMGEGDK